MYNILLLSLLLAPFTLTTGLTFTGPDTKEKLNLSSTITVTWVEGPTFGNSSVFDLWFNGLSTDGTEFGYGTLTH